MGLRCFVALELPDELKRGIYDQASGLRSIASSVKWVSQQNLHITLDFLGDADDAMIDRIEAAINSATNAHRQFPISFEGMGAFPSLRRPRVFWVGMRGAEPLTALQGDVERALEALGFAFEQREFKPHLTIGRAKDIRPIEARKLAEYIGETNAARYGEMVVTTISLMKSDLRPQGPIYTRLASAQIVP